MKNSVRLASWIVIVGCGVASIATHRASITSRMPSAASAPSLIDQDWTRWARTVGQAEAETERNAAITHLKSIRHLKSLLLEALPTKNRSMALDVMSALNMCDLVNDLMVYMAADEDGFLTLTINSLMNEKNQETVLNTYTSNLQANQLSKFSPATIVGMLEPMGRLGTELPDAVIKNLATQKSPEVRSAALYYLRMMALAHGKYSQNELIKPFLTSSEFQLRLQAVSTLMEFVRSRVPQLSSFSTRGEILEICRNEKTKTVRQYCLSLVQKARGQR